MQKSSQDFQDQKESSGLKQLPEGYSSFKVFPAPSVVKKLKMEDSGKHVIFQNDSITFGELLKKYLLLINESGQNVHRIRLVMPKGIRLDGNCTVAWFKKEFFIDTIVDFEILAIIDNMPQIKKISEEFLDNFTFDCFLTKQVLNQTGDQLHLHFILDEHSIQGKFSKQMKFNYFKRQLLQLIAPYINSKTKITEKDFNVSKFTNNNVEEKLKFQIFQRSSSQILIKDIFEQFELIEIKMMNKDVEIFPPKTNADEKHLIISLQNGKSLRLHFNNIRHYQVNIFLKKIGHQHLEGMTCSCGLKLLDKILRPHEVIIEFQEEMIKFAKFGMNVQIKIIEEGYVFYEQLKGLKQFQSSQLTVNNPEILVKCQERAKIIIEAKKQNIYPDQQVPFQNWQEIYPILLYTSSLMVIDHNNPPQALYQLLNRCLRQKSINTTTKLQISQNWKYQFVSSLLESLFKLNDFRGIVFRGVNLHFEEKVGDRIMFKQFTTTSKRRIDGHRNTRDPIKSTAYTIHCLHGKQISPLSCYKHQEQVVILPYTEFYVESVTLNRNVREVQLREVYQTPLHKSIPKYDSTFILWVDDKFKEGQRIFKTIHFPINSTFMVQLASTDQLKSWIHQNQRFLKKSETMRIRFGMITNMRRVENNQEVKQAGAYAIKYCAKQIPNVEIIVYIANVQQTKIKLAENGIDPSTIKISNKQSQVKDFLKQMCTPSVDMEEKDVDEELRIERRQQGLGKFLQCHLQNQSKLKQLQESMI